MIPFHELSGIQYGVAESSDLDEMAAFLGGVFSHEDPVALALGVTPEEFEDLVRLFCPQAAVDGLTVVARLAATGAMIGALLTEDASSAPPSGMERVSQKFDPIIDLMGQLDTEYRQGKSVLPGDWLHLFLLGVPQPFGGRGVGHQLIASCLENGARKGYRLALRKPPTRFPSTSCGSRVSPSGSGGPIEIIAIKAKPCSHPSKIILRPF